MIKVDSYFFHCNPKYVVSHFKAPKKSILFPFSSKFDLLLPRVCIHMCFKFGSLFKEYGGELIVQSQAICFKTKTTRKFH